MGKSEIREFHTMYKREGLTSRVVSLFQDFIWQYYHEFGRTFPWRETNNPYHILVSEIMLQQTQVSRVVSKYDEFISTFPDFFTLASAPLRDVLGVWQGLGYNRRALALHQTAQKVMVEFDGQLSSSPDVLQKFPGIGPYTAASIAAIAFNKPAVFIETNIRTVFLYSFFFSEASDRITNHDILPLVEATLDRKNPREWYYALFDYGAMLKRQREDVPRTVHRTQGKFQGSNRQIRGNIIRLLVTRDSIPEQELVDTLDQNSERVRQIIAQLHEEGLIAISGGLIRIQ